MPLAFLVGIQQGAIGLAWAWLLAYPLFTLATVRIAGAPIGLRVSDLLPAIAPGIACSAAMALIVLGVDAILPGELPAPIRLGALVAAGGASFSALVLIFARGTVDDLIRLVLRRQAPNAAA